MERHWAEIVAVADELLRVTTIDETEAETIADIIGCRGRGSNPHVPFRTQDLSPQRLPGPPPGHNRTFDPVSGTERDHLRNQLRDQPISPPARIPVSLYQNLPAASGSEQRNVGRAGRWGTPQPLGSLM